MSAAGASLFMDHEYRVAGVALPSESQADLLAFAHGHRKGFFFVAWIALRILVELRPMTRISKKAGVDKDRLTDREDILDSDYAHSWGNQGFP